MAETGVECNSLPIFSPPINVSFFPHPLLKTFLGVLAFLGYLECVLGFPVDSTFKESKYEIANLHKLLCTHKQNHPCHGASRGGLGSGMRQTVAR